MRETWGKTSDLLFSSSNDSERPMFAWLIGNLYIVFGLSHCGEMITLREKEKVEERNEWSKIVKTKYNSRIVIETHVVDTFWALNQKRQFITKIVFLAFAIHSNIPLTNFSSIHSDPASLSPHRWKHFPLILEQKLIFFRLSPFEVSLNFF